MGLQSSGLIVATVRILPIIRRLVFLQHVLSFRRVLRRVRCNFWHVIAHLLLGIHDLSEFSVLFFLELEETPSSVVAVELLVDCFYLFWGQLEGRPNYYLPDHNYLLDEPIFPGLHVSFEAAEVLIEGVFVEIWVPFIARPHILNSQAQLAQIVFYAFSFIFVLLEINEEVLTAIVEKELDFREVLSNQLGIKEFEVLEHIEEVEELALFKLLFVNVIKLLLKML